MRLIAYRKSADAPVLRPASPRREWMDRSPDRFAYRCLPLTIANAHGWDLLCPCALEAMWTGSPAGNGVKVVPLGTSRHALPEGHFGEGVLTFYTGYTFRTEPPYALYVTGPANVRKDGIVPLAGIVETTWLPVPFTMNWGFTRPGVAVRFEEGEAFCTVFPVRLDQLEAVEPEIRDFADADADFREQHGRWTASRGAWAEEREAALRENRPRKEEWQRFYTSGIHSDGTRPAGDGAHHRTRLHVKPFVVGAASAASPDEASAHSVLQPIATGEHTTTTRSSCPMSQVGSAEGASMADAPTLDHPPGNGVPEEGLLVMAPTLLVEELTATFIVVRAVRSDGTSVRHKLARGAYDLLRRFAVPTPRTEVAGGASNTARALKCIDGLESAGLLVTPELSCAPPLPAESPAD